MHQVEDDAGLDAACSACAASAAIGVDTEFERTSTYFARPALIQLHDGARAWLVDPLAIRDLAPLGRLLARTPPAAIMHGALEDLAVLEQATGTAPADPFDTQLAAAFAGEGFSLGYDKLVLALLGVHVSKAETRSDWLRRPLSPAQLHYAVTDVEHLGALHAKLRERLDAAGRLAWLEEETRTLRARSREEESSRDFLKLVRRAPDDARVRGSLHALCAWRDAEARRRDRPRRRIADDDLLLALAIEPPRDRDALRSLEAWRGHRDRGGAEALLSAAREAADATPRPLPGEAADLSAHRAALACMRDAVARAAGALELPAALLAPRRLVEKLLVHARIDGLPGMPEEFCGWRAPLLADALAECLRRA